MNEKKEKDQVMKKGISHFRKYANIHIVSHIYQYSNDIVHLMHGGLVRDRRASTAMAAGFDSRALRHYSQSILLPRGG
jgi:ribosomal protein S11